jgi:hypothetical protein
VPPRSRRPLTRFPFSTDPTKPEPTVTKIAATSLVIEPTPTAPAPAPGDDVLFDPEDDLLPPPKPADERPARKAVASLVVVQG